MKQQEPEPAPTFLLHPLTLQYIVFTSTDAYSRWHHFKHLKQNTTHMFTNYASSSIIMKDFSDSLKLKS